VTVEALEPLALPAYLGSTLRGAFGHAFRTLACLAPRASACPVPASCPYHLVFETAPPPGATALRTHEGDLAPFWPYLVFGQWVHVGKGATFGLGGYRLEPPA
jgi:hypothetical protein